MWFHTLLIAEDTPDRKSLRVTYGLGIARTNLTHCYWRRSNDLPWQKGARRGGLVCLNNLGPKLKSSVKGNQVIQRLIWQLNQEKEWDLEWREI